MLPPQLLLSPRPLFTPPPLVPTINVPLSPHRAGETDSTSTATTVVYSTVVCSENKCFSVVTSGVESETVYTTAGSVITSTVTVPCDTTTVASAPTTTPVEKENTASTTLTAVVYSVTSCSNGECSVTEIETTVPVTATQETINEVSTNVDTASVITTPNTVDSVAVSVPSVETVGGSSSEGEVSSTAAVALYEGGAGYLKPLGTSLCAVLAGLLLI
ncbi:unnamed protein product [Ambrosiozyma monospora]|uniref:Unnamed protein product n=1 Tax=Ambrosiozyma monospora TaxID=43982 RepID=A0ACB5U2Y9_AMBMO|nr:unnamed protein product [Ambrosiozyma monospora]